MRKIIFPILLGGLVISCSDKENKNNNTSEQLMEKVEYLYKDGDKSHQVVITTPPQKAALFTPHMTEMLLALDLSDRMVLGTTEGPVLPLFEKDYEKVPNKAIGHSFKMTKEAFLLMEPDFASGDGDLNPESTGSAEELIAQGISPFTLKSVAEPKATLETVYEDFLMLGRIFNVQDKANEVVNGMKSKLAEAQKDFVNPTEDEKKKIMIISSYNNGAWIFADLASDLARHANAKNIYEDVNNTYEFVSYESVVDRNPDAIFITDTESRGMTIEEKAEFLRQHPILKNINAVKTNSIYPVNFADVSPGVRNVDFIIRLHNILYKGGK